VREAKEHEYQALEEGKGTTKHLLNAGSRRFFEHKDSAAIALARAIQFLSYRTSNRRAFKVSMLIEQVSNTRSQTNGIRCVWRTDHLPTLQRSTEYQQSHNDVFHFCSIDEAGELLQVMPRWRHRRRRYRTTSLLPDHA